MPGTFESRAFPAWVAFCTAVAVAVASGITVDDSVPARIGAGFAGLAVGVALAFATAAVVSARPEPKQAPPPQTEPEPPPAPRPEPLEAPAAVLADDRRPRLEAMLAAADPNGDVEGWIASAQALVGETVPSASGYFAALGSRTFADDRSRLEAHRARLATIVRDFL